VDRESALETELRDHVERQVADNRRAGMSEAEARRQAHLSVGGVAQVKERVRDEWRPRVLTDLARDLRFGARLIRRSPLFAALVLATLVFAVGANVTVYTIVNAIWLEPRPVHEPERVVVVTNRAVAVDEVIDMISARQLEELRALPVFDGVAHQVVGAGLLGDARPRLDLPDSPRALEPLAVTANYFDVLGLEIRGRAFTQADDEPGAPAVAIISDALWRATYGADAAAIGAALPTSPEPVTVVGIAPPGFRGARLGELVDVWIPRALAPRMSTLRVLMQESPEMIQRTSPGIALARLRPGITPAEVHAALNPERDRYRRAFPLSSVIGLPGRVTTPLGSRNVFVAVSAMAGLVLLAGCATLAALILVHLERRRQELAVRMALGCGRSRLARAVLAEVGLLAVAGIGLSLVVASWLLAAMRSHTLPSGLGLDRLDLTLDWKIAAFALAIGTTTMACAALLPLLRFSRPAVALELAGGASTTSGASLRLRGALLAVHVAATVVVLVGAALFVRTVTYGFTRAPGFDVDRTVFLTVQPSIVEFHDPTTNPEGDARQAMMRAAYDRLLDGLRSAPNVRAVALGGAPVRFEGVSASVTSEITLDLPEGERELVIGSHLGDAGYVDALGLTLLAGAVPADGNGSLITASLAERLWPGEPALGRYLSRNGTASHIVGVVNDFVQGSVSSGAVGGLVAVSASIDSIVRPGASGRASLVVSTVEDAAGMVPVVERLTREVFPRAATLRVASGRQLLEFDLGRERLGAAFFAVFGLVSLALGVAAVFGLVAYLAESRAREFGVRLALGATPNRLIGVVVGTSLVPVVAGTVAGLAAAALLSGAVASLLHGINALDTVSYAGAAGVVLATAAVAGLAAALRIRQLSPSDALRAE
jgi:predicted permease